MITVDLGILGKLSLNGQLLKQTAGLNSFLALQFCSLSALVPSFQHTQQHRRSTLETPSSRLNCNFTSTHGQSYRLVFPFTSHIILKKMLDILSCYPQILQRGLW